MDNKTIEELKKKLDPKHVAARKQGGAQVSYIEGWHAIAEANRIFGFDAWMRETVFLNVVSERERKIGQQQKEGWGVTYIARVRITVGDIIREGVGAGHGIDVDLGQAHESAIKEAETDAMKRAFMTFGNPFGLALYDKSRENVGVDTYFQTSEQRVEWMKKAKEAIDRLESPEAITKWMGKNAHIISELGEKQQDAMNKVAVDRKNALMQAPLEAAE